MEVIVNELNECRLGIKLWKFEFPFFCKYMKRSWLLLVVLLATTACLAVDVNLSEETTNSASVNDDIGVSKVVVRTSGSYLLDDNLKSTSLADPFRIGPPPDPFPTEPDEPVSVTGGLICLLLFVVLYAGIKFANTNVVKKAFYKAN